MATAEIQFDTNAWSPIETNTPQFSVDAGTNVNKTSHAFDDTTENFLNAKFKVPGDVDTSGTVTFRAYVWAATAAASKNIELRFGHLALNDSEDWDPVSAYTNEDSGDKAIDATQDDVSEITWTETITNLGWAADDAVYCRLSRIAPSANNLVGDMHLDIFSVEIPLA